MTAAPGLGYGIIGCGWVASAHAWGVRSLEDQGVRLVAVADKDGGRAREVGDRFGAEHVLEDYRALLERPDIDAVSVCLPDFLHREVVIAAAEAGKHVLCEKPLALDLESADAMVHACAQAGVELGLIMNHRYAPGNIQAHAAVRAGALGRQLVGSVIHSSGLKGDPEGTSEWRGRRGLATGGVLSTQAIHFLDLLLWLMGPVATVDARVASLTDHPDEHEDTACLSLGLESGALATLVTTNGSPIMDDFTGTRIEVHGSDGWILLEGDVVRTYSTVTDVALPEIVLPEPPPGSEEIVFGVGHVHEIQDFVAAIGRDVAAPVPGTDGRHLMAVLSAAYRSAQEGRAMQVDAGMPAYVTDRTDPGSLLFAADQSARG
jgi:UDP-N-acetyl-2-amino-2-deoxyglucuronate dehydrogenase